MSKTYRRKGYIPEWVYADIEEMGRVDIKYISQWTGKPVTYTRIIYTDVLLSGKEKEAEVKKFQRDGMENKWHNPPTWFVNMFCQRKYRMHQKQVIKKMMKSGDFEDYVFLDPDNPDWKWD